MEEDKKQSNLSLQLDKLCRFLRVESWHELNRSPCEEIFQGLFLWLKGEKILRNERFVIYNPLSIGFGTFQILVEDTTRAKGHRNRSEERRVGKECKTR